MVIYGVSADVSIGGLFLAGVIPGLLMAAALSGLVTVVATRRNMPRHPFPGLGDVWRAYKRAHWALMTPVILFGGMMAGVMPGPGGDAPGKESLPVTVFGRYVKVLLSSNEFLFVR